MKGFLLIFTVIIYFMACFGSDYEQVCINYHYSRFQTNCTNYSSIQADSEPCYFGEFCFFLRINNITEGGLKMHHRHLKGNVFKKIFDFTNAIHKDIN
ncbi:hypothetical protein ABEB36_010055 [Hypothenemus hampei]|uniref:Uncharacterized protein n=1 Tax=Hypothenemus hampei TaxID=57062 RepID=A0ABD1EIC5_HYPHA